MQHFTRNDDFAETLTIAEMLLDNEEDLIQKATRWILRKSFYFLDPAESSADLVTPGV